MFFNFVSSPRYQANIAKVAFFGIADLFSGVHFFFGKESLL